MQSYIRISVIVDNFSESDYSELKSIYINGVKTGYIPILGSKILMTESIDLYQTKLTNLTSCFPSKIFYFSILYSNNEFLVALSIQNTSILSEDNIDFTDMILPSGVNMIIYPDMVTIGHGTDLSDEFKMYNMQFNLKLC